MVKRYEPYTDESSCDMCGQMIEQQDGQYVSYSDHAALESSNSKLQADNIRLTLRVENLVAECQRLRVLMKEAHEFWCEYSSYGESMQDDMNDERFAMLAKMAVADQEPT